MRPGQQQSEREQYVALMEQQRAEQGLPPRIEDVAVLTRIATIMRLADRRIAVVEPKRRRRRKR